jgi:hypothetical protein
MTTTTRRRRWWWWWWWSRRRRRRCWLREEEEEDDDDEEWIFFCTYFNHLRRFKHFLELSKCENVIYSLFMSGERDVEIGYLICLFSMSLYSSINLLRVIVSTQAGVILSHKAETSKANFLTVLKSTILHYTLCFIILMDLL